MALDFSTSLAVDTALVASFFAAGLVAGLVRRRWLERAFDRGASIRHVEFKQPAYALTSSGTWARFEVRAAPLLMCIALVSVCLLVAFGLPGVVALLVGRTPPYSIGLGFLGAVAAIAIVPCVITRMTIRVEPGRLEFELVRFLRRTVTWSVRPQAVTFAARGRGLAMHVTYALGSGVPGPVLFDAGLLDPSSELLEDLADVGATLTAAGTGAPGPV